MSSTLAALPYQLFSALEAGAAMARSFPDQDRAQMFYDCTHGPLPFAKSVYADERLVSCFVRGFLEAFEARGFAIFSRRA